MRVFLFLAVVVVFAGCQSAPKPVPVAAPVVAVAPAPAAEPAPLEPTIEDTPEAKEARDRLLMGGHQHEMRMKSAFRSSPGFRITNWSGIVLTPKDLKQGVVVGSGYRLDRVEIHPLADGRLRVWVEVLNATRETLQPEGACEFRPTPNAPLLKFKPLPAVGPGKRILVSFESDLPQMESYSILVRNKR